LQLAIPDEKLEKLQMMDQVYAITSPVLIPLSEPQKASNLILSEVILTQKFRFRNSILSIHFSV